MDNKKEKALLIFEGLLAGFFSGALGIGGGVLIIPLLTIFFGLSLKKAIGTSLAAIIPASLVGLVAHMYLAPQDIKWRVAILMVLGAFFGARIGISILMKISNNIHTRAFSLLLLIVALRYINIIRFPETFRFSPNIEIIALVLFGVFIGTLSSMFGIGGGVVMVPMLNLFFGLTLFEAIATSLAVIFPTTILAALFHKGSDNMELKTVKLFIPAVFVAAIVGAIVVQSIPIETIKYILGIFILVCSIQIFFQTEKNNKHVKKIKSIARKAIFK